MWPNVFGPGWLLMALAALGMLLFLIALVYSLWAAAVMRGSEIAVPPDQDLWRRYEAGDLTRVEFDRLRKRKKAA